jgi:hypothetical protein
MTRLVPLTIELEPEVYRAVHLRGEKDGWSAPAVVNALLRKVLAAEIEEVAGLPPLADMIQSHHNREQSNLRQQHQQPKHLEP